MAQDEGFAASYTGFIFRAGIAFEVYLCVDRRFAVFPPRVPPWGRPLIRTRDLGEIDSAIEAYLERLPALGNMRAKACPPPKQRRRLVL